ncbi:toprim domain-containing protein [Candidatus Methylospira mobilis]|uniref:Toprim domain-containing protein n=1 Tax=Candidatus Methylospira mobilis TaxID=1808979 RepID=A0A5Q0BKD1_9GAMM|nr:PriCT-2 domain-containing protein [Candidatus Methylospira mobilis]QFY42681.1 toprim domain-containing protein [Candidatus Methylospira mobilis]
MTLHNEKTATGWHREAASIDRINNAIIALPADDREIWLRAGMAIKSELGDDGFTIWSNWSQSAENYRATDARDVWKSFKTGKVTIGTLFYLAKQNGWTNAGRTRRPSRAEIEQRKRTRQETEAKEQTEREAAHQAAKCKAEQQWRVARPAPVDNWYLQKKHAQPHGIRCQGDVLLIPMQDECGEIWNVQKIDRLHGKRFMYQARVFGLFHVIGELTEAILICEGYATGATIHEQTGYQTYVAFTAGNLMAVAQTVHRLNPGKKITLCADNDRHTAGNPGVTKANAAALAVGGHVAIPPFPDGVPGTDFNDLHVYRMGLVAGACHE